jgi:hypothetical protein
MKRKNLIFVMLLVLSALYTMQSCKKESTVAFTEQQAFTIPTLVGPSQGFLNLTGTTVDLKWESTNAAGAPNNFTVYFSTGDDPALYQKNVTTTSLTVPVVVGTKYVWRIVATDANGITQSSPIWAFETVNPAAPLDMTMTWTTDAQSVIGLSIAPDKAVDLRLLVLKANQTSNAVSPINTASYEEFAKFNTLADGVYYIATDISSTINYNDGTSSIPFDISIDLTFKQRGVQLDPLGYVKTLSFPTVMTNEFSCSSYKTFLAKVTKVGNVYTIDKAVSYVVPAVPAALAGKWYGSDFGYTSKIQTSIVGGNLLIDSVGVGWVSDMSATGWGEVPQSITKAKVLVNICTGTVTIPNQKFMVTKYLGKVQTAYYIQGKGTFDLSGAFPTMTLNYDFIQGGTSIASAGFGVKSFKAVITMNPAAAKSLQATSGLLLAKPHASN